MCEFPFVSCLYSRLPRRLRYGCNNLALSTFVLLQLTAASAEELRLVQFTDVHSQGPHYSEKAFLAACSEGLSTQPAGLLLSGDHADNSFDQDHFGSRFPLALKIWKEPLANYSGQLFFALGNDDFGHNYQSRPEDLSQTYKDCRQVFGQRYYLDGLGNGVAPSRLGGLRWLTINSVFFSPLNQTPQAEQQAQATLEWLRGQLPPEGKETVVLMSHIAPIMDLYTKQPAWKPDSVAQLQEILADYPGQVVVISGHHHRNHVYGLRPERPAPVLVGGALATKFGYQPNWRHYRWQVEQGRISQIDYDLHYPGHREWNARYQLRPDQLQDFLDRLRDDWNFARGYVDNIYGHHMQCSQWDQDLDIRQRLLRDFWVNPNDWR
jgi:hypothetical protein